MLGRQAQLFGVSPIRQSLMAKTEEVGRAVSRFEIKAHKFIRIPPELPPFEDFWKV
jgi:hypothetical protein